MSLAKKTFLTLTGLALLVAMAWATVAPATSPAPAPAAGSSIPVLYESGIKRINIGVVSSAPEIAQLMQKAFSLHGAFDSTAAVPVQYVLHFESAGTGRVAVSVESKAGGGTIFQAEATGATTVEAAYRAGDAVVEKLTQKPGFFAGKLAFVSQRTKYREIFESDILGQKVAQLTADRSTSSVPRFSPDGTKLLYTGYYRTGFPDIVLYNLATHARTTFAAYEGTNTGGTFSPDGQRVAMILSTKEGSTEVYVADATGKNPTRLTRDAKSSKASPTWSPDGRQIIFTADPRGSPLLYEISASGSSARPLPSSLTTNRSYCADPAWNPRDASQVAFMEEEGTQFFIAVYDLQKRQTKVFSGAVGSDPCWLNDGRHLIFTHRLSGTDQLYILDTETEKVKQLTTLGASEATWVYGK
jgi:TolB protein